MQRNSTQSLKNLADTIENETINDNKSKPKITVIAALLNYSKSLEFKKSNYVKQVELVLN